MTIGENSGQQHGEATESFLLNWLRTKIHSFLAGDGETSTSYLPMIDKIDYIHTRLLAMTYEWSHRHNGVINIVALILAFAISVYIFYFAKSKKERWAVISLALLMNILVLVVGILNKAKFGVGFMEYVVWGPGAILFMDIAYFFHIKRKMKTWAHVVAFIIFLMSSLVLTVSFVLTEIIPANVLINWGTL